MSETTGISREIEGGILDKTWCWCCYWTVRLWPFSCFNRLAWPVYLWSLPWYGEEAFRRGEL